MSENNSVIPKDLTNYLKHYGFFFPNAEIYGGLAKAWDLGPYGAELKRNLKKLCQIITHPQVLEASGHRKNFHDWLTECLNCRKRYRLDKVLSTAEFTSFLEGEKKFTELSSDLGEVAVKKEYSLKEKNCPNCQQRTLVPPRQFNLLLTTNLEITEGKENTVYLRPETCQGIFINFLAIQKSTRRQLPFGIGQIGKSFRNEITLHHGIFRTREFEQTELEFFCPGEESEHQHSQKDLRVNGIIPEVIEISFGVERLMLAILQDAYHEEKVVGSQTERTVLRLPPLLAPFFVAIIPLSQQLRNTAYQLYTGLLPEVNFSLTYEEAPNIGKAYRRQDAIGTYYCLTVDFQTAQDDTLTLRHRDSMKQERIRISNLKNYLYNLYERHWSEFSQK
ncbi:16076_t:CDS:2 [Cetraspora pellucida]|uniref:16076_t:CDS:1 n=1 Tax=Cetraspora pellucida TaxID=1433469 RepID=A0ACA9L4S2_9GLOM|nr:16076_t:CDS:2 [Cetraspora pellucida]